MGAIRNSLIFDWAARQPAQACYALIDAATGRGAAYDIAGALLAEDAAIEWLDYAVANHSRKLPWRQAVNDPLMPRVIPPGLQGTDPSGWMLYVLTHPHAVNAADDA